MDGWIWIENFHEHLKICTYVCMFTTVHFMREMGVLHGSLLKKIEISSRKWWQDVARYNRNGST